MSQDKKYIPYGMQWIDEKDIKKITDVLKGSWITTGPKIHEFERAFAEYIGCKYAVAVNSGTSALNIAVASLDMKGEVITTPFTFAATSNMIILNGLKPVFADIKPDTYNINPDEIKKKITDKTKAILYMDYAGQPCDIEKMREIATEYNIHLIEDAAHALGAEYRNKKVGNMADITCFSFHPVKHIATGEGGMITTNNEKLYKKMLLLRNHGIDKPTSERFGSQASYMYDMKLLGTNCRITDFQCALGISQLEKLEMFLKRREEITKIYSKAFEDIKEITTPTIKKNVRHAWHLYTILLDNSINRDEFFNLMRAKNIGVNVHYIPVYRFSYYKKFRINPKEFPVTEDISNRIITLPLFPKMKNDDVRRVITEVKSTLNEMKK